MIKIAEGRKPQTISWRKKKKSKKWLISQSCRKLQLDHKQSSHKQLEPVDSGFRNGTGVKNPPANARDVGSIPGSGRSNGVGNDNPLQYSCLENSINRGTWQGLESIESMLLLLLSRFSRVRLCATPWTAAYQASPSMGFSRQEHWSGLPFPSPMHESGK